MKARHACLLALAAVTSCALPKFGTVDSFDDGSGGTSSGRLGGGEAGMPAQGGGSASGGSQTANPGAGEANGGGEAGSVNGGNANGGSLDGGTSGMAGSGGNRACPTPPNTTSCPSGCVNALGDPKNCGQCGRVCPASQACVEGECKCEGDTLFCDNQCVPNGTSEHCGSCSTQCSGGLECGDKSCRLCPSGCALLSGPFTSYNDQMAFDIILNPPVNLKGKRLTVRTYSPETDLVYCSFTLYNKAGQMAFGNCAAGEGRGWETHDIDLNQEQSDFTLSTRLHFFVYNSTRTPTRLYIDWVHDSSNALGPFDFATSTSPLVIDANETNIDASATWVKN
jgi:hypothetical protein